MELPRNHESLANIRLERLLNEAILRVDARDTDFRVLAEVAEFYADDLKASIERRTVSSIGPHAVWSRVKSLVRPVFNLKNVNSVLILLRAEETHSTSPETTSTEWTLEADLGFSKSVFRWRSSRHWRNGLIVRERHFEIDQSIAWISVGDLQHPSETRNGPRLVPKHRT